jgi:hypothetical protein
MIISRAYAGKLLREGKAVINRHFPDGKVLPDAHSLKEIDDYVSIVQRSDGSRWIMITRLDNYRTDHFQIR